MLTLTLLEPHKTSLLEQVEQPEQAPETLITSDMEVFSGHNRVEEAWEAEEEMLLEAEEDLAERDHPDLEMETEVLKTNLIHPSNHNLVTIPMLILISDL